MTPRLDRPVLVDTSVWISHFKRPLSGIADVIDADLLVTHEFVLGELTLGALPRGSQVLTDLASYPCLPSVAHDEVVNLVQRQRLQGSGIGWIDVHLAAAALLAHARLWTVDKSLASVAVALGIDP